MVSFWIFYSLLGFVLPTALLTVSLILPRSEKLGYPRYWYSVAIISELWILTAIILAATLVLG